MTKTKKIVSELDKSIIREMKKNRVYSKVSTSDISTISLDDLFNTLVTIIESLTDDKIIIYICDKLYDDNDINLLLHVEDTKCIVTNNDILYDRLVNHSFNLNKAVLKYYKK